MEVYRQNIDWDNITKIYTETARKNTFSFFVCMIKTAKAIYHIWPHLQYNKLSVNICLKVLTCSESVAQKTFIQPFFCSGECGELAGSWRYQFIHYKDAMASQITGNTTMGLTACFCELQRKHQRSAIRGFSQGRIQDLRLGVAHMWPKCIGKFETQGGCIDIFQIRLL